MKEHNNIHKTAIVSNKAQIGNNVTIGPYTIIYDNAIIANKTVIDGFCEIGYPTQLAGGKPLIIGENSLIRSHTILYEGSVFGERLMTGHHVTIREKTIAGKNFQVGTMTDLQGDCFIGDYVRIHSKVHMGKLTTIGNFVWIFPYVVFTNDPSPPSNNFFGVKVEDYAVICAKSVVMPGVKIGTHSLVAAQSMVKYDVAPNHVVAGYPARKICETSSIKLNDGSEKNAYPWPRHFHRGYPEGIVQEWVKRYQ